MTVLLDTDIYPILEASSGEDDTRTLSVDLGDGYRQVVPDGINTDQEIQNLVFRAFLPVKARALIAILKASRTGTVNILQFTAVGDDTQKYWRAGKISTKSINGRIQITCPIERTYPLTV